MESGVLLVHRSTGALRDRCAPRRGVRCVSTWQGLDDPPTRRFSSAGGFFGRPRRLRARAFDRAHIDVVDIDVVDIDVVVTRLAPQLASQLPPRAARAWNERRRRPRSPTASTTSPRRRHLALRLSRRARARCARRSRHVALRMPLLAPPCARLAHWMATRLWTTRPGEATARRARVRVGFMRRPACMSLSVRRLHYELGET